jgi:hypothetical protein
MNKRNITKKNLPNITPTDFYSSEMDKTKINWFLFEYAAEFNSTIKKSLRTKLNRKQINNKKIAELCIHFAKHMKREILDKLAGNTENVSLSYRTIEEFFPSISDKLVDDLLSAAYGAWSSITSMCVNCPTRCISEKDQKAPMFDDPFYYE